MCKNESTVTENFFSIVSIFLKFVCYILFCVSYIVRSLDLVYEWFNFISMVLKIIFKKISWKIKVTVDL